MSDGRCLSGWKPAGWPTLLADEQTPEVAESLDGPADRVEIREPSRARRPGRVRMTSAERREQLIAVSRSLFASRGFEGTSVEEIAARAQVSKPVVYEHFGGKEGLYAVVVDR